MLKIQNPKIVERATEAVERTDFVK